MKTAGAFAISLAFSALALNACAPEQAQELQIEENTAEDEPTLAQRLAFMAGHVEAGIALYRAGESAAGGPHLLHPVSESYADEREGLDAIGFDPAPYEAVSKALEAGRPASEIEPQLALVEANLAEMRRKAGGEPDQLIAHLMKLVVEEYRIGVTGGRVTDDGEYQDAWGFAVAARKLAEELPDPKRKAVVAELGTLIALWPEDAPTIPDAPASPEAVIEQAANVNAILLGLEDR